MPIWDAALVLAHYLMIQPPEFLAGKRVIELGAGCGLVSLTCATRNALVTISDLSMLLPLINSNVQSNLTAEEQARTSVQELRWGTNAAHLNPPFDFIFASDCIYTVQHFPELAQSLEDLSGPHTRILMANESRWADVDRWWSQELLERGFKIEELPTDLHHPVYRHHVIKIYSITPPSEPRQRPLPPPLVDDDGNPIGPRRRIIH